MVQHFKPDKEILSVMGFRHHILELYTTIITKSLQGWLNMGQFFFLMKHGMEWNRNYELCLLLQDHSARQIKKTTQVNTKIWYDAGRLRDVKNNFTLSYKIQVLLCVLCMLEYVLMAKTDLYNV